jgi:tRNA A-37 threonylcarbamoyl transferase component Bud32
VIGRVLGSYRIISLLGEGGMGAVYLAEHPIIRKQAAVKVLRPECSGNAEMLERFFNEARATARLEHPAFVEIFDCGVEAGNAFIVMEYVRGESLGARLARVQRFPVAVAVDLGRQIAHAVALAHAGGIVHRDLKPDNIIIAAGDPEELKILDFGIAKLSTQTWDRMPTRTGVMMGTPAYMSPEQCRGVATVDERADIYSLGCILYALLIGDPPFSAMSDAELVALQLYQPVAPLRDHDPNIPLELDRLVQRTLAKQPEDRPRTMAEVEAALSHLLGTISSAPTLRPLALAPALAARANTTLARTAGELAPPPRRTALWGLLAGAAVAIGGGALVLRGRRRQPPPPVAVAVPPPPPDAGPLRPDLGVDRPHTVTVQIRSEPPGATVSRGQEVLGLTPLERVFPRAEGTLELTVSKKGYRPRTVQVPLDGDAALSVPLNRIPAVVDPDEWRKL